MVRRLIAVLAVVACVVTFAAWRETQKTQALKRRYDCPEGLGSQLPPRDAPRSPDAPAEVGLEKVGRFMKPVAMATGRDDEALYFAEKDGRVIRFAAGRSDVLIDLTKEVSLDSEQGLLGLAFSPDGSHLYTNHTDPAGDTHVTEWAVVDGKADDRRDVLFVDQPHQWHNGGQLAFGPDGMLYVGLGDGGGQADPWRNGQSLDTLLGKVVRIDPARSGSTPYTVPDDNPFVGVEDARPEIWAYGMRNPWRFSFDAKTGDLWIADVGDGCFEELDVERAGFKGGANYGWRNAEGPWLVDGPAPDGYVEPVYSYRRDGATTCAVVGGYVYRGAAIPALQGWYIFGDYCHGHVMAWQGPGHGEPVSLGVRVTGLTSFGVDNAGELYATSIVGDVFRLLPASEPVAP